MTIIHYTTPESAKAPVEGKVELGEKVYHGTNRDFDEFDVNRAYNARNDKLGAGKAIYFSVDESVASKYANANALESFDKVALDEISDPMAKDLAQYTYRDGLEKGFEKYYKKYPDEYLFATASKNFDVNDVTDVVQNTRGAKLDKGEFDGQEDVMYALIGGSPTDIQNYVPAAKRLGIKSVPKKPYVKTATISPKAKIKNLGFTKNVLQEASKARKEGYDGIRYTSPEVVDSIEEIAIFNNKALESQATKAPVENQTMTVEPTDVMAQVRAKMNQDNVDGVEAAKRLGVTKEYEQAINSEMSKAYRENTEPLMPKTPQVSKTETQATTSLEQEAKKYKTAEEFVEAARSIENFDPAEAKTIFKDVKTGDGEAGVVKALTEFYNKANPSTETNITDPKLADNKIDTDDLKTERPQAYKMIDELSRELRDIDSANGVELIEPSVDAAYSATDDTYRVSTNTPFYKQHYKDTGRKPTLGHYRDEARRILSGGTDNSYGVVGPDQVAEFNHALVEQPSTEAYANTPEAIELDTQAKLENEVKELRKQAARKPLSTPVDTTPAIAKQLRMQNKSMFLITLRSRHSHD